ncbi:hypothetical protein BD626DRAFT_576928 [Schizophyllum amplum]|uniref:Uncharacterized protein n=1 Tax=Schizophyllum amplum TaxID=97359 RepID=A0A550BSX6_9AGAR|nr:hypothetical protein BD626DRAFT_576928 [Auriculariopsis ampla]
MDSERSMTSSRDVDPYAHPFLPIPARAKVPFWRTRVKECDSKRKSGPPTGMPASAGGVIDSQSIIEHLQARINELERERETPFKVRVVNPEVLCREDLVRDNFRLQEEVMRLKRSPSLGEGVGSPSGTCESPLDLAQKVRDYESLIARLKGDYLELRKRQDALLERNMVLSHIVYTLERINMEQAEHIAELEHRAMRSKMALQQLSRMHQEAEKARQQVHALTSAMGIQLSEWQADDADEASDSDACVVA